MKKIILACVLIIATLSLCGCQSTTELVVPVSSMQSEVSSLYLMIEYDEENLQEMGMATGDGLAVIKNAIQTKANVYISQMSLKYHGIINDLKEDGELTDVQKNLLWNHLSFYNGWSENSYTVEFRFYSDTSAKLFMQYGSAYLGTETTEGFFANKTNEQFIDLFVLTPGNIISTNVETYFSNGIYEAVSSNFDAEEANKLEDITISYGFLTTNTRLHTNSQFSLSVSDGVLHIWESTDNDHTIVFEMYTLEANRYVWYTISLAVTFTVTAIVLIVIYFKKDKKKKENVIQ